MPYNEIDDNRDSYGEKRLNLDYDTPTVHHSEVIDDENKSTLVLDITSNDDILHIPSFKRTLNDALENFVNKEGVNRIITSLLDLIQEEDRYTTMRWEFALPLEGKTFNQLIIQVYPTYESWKHLREK